MRILILEMKIKINGLLGWLVEVAEKRLLFDSLCDNNNNNNNINNNISNNINNLSSH
jgi:hypothetical protein